MIKVDLKNAVQGIDLNQIESQIESANNYYQNSNFGFRNIINSYQDLSIELEKVSKLFQNFSTLVVIGIGGSDLGTRAIVQALKGRYLNQKNNKKIYFTGDTTDPDAIQDLHDVLNLSETLFLVVSKSGNTIEQGSVFLYFKELISKEVGIADSKKHFVFLTDPKSGILRELADSEGYTAIHIPSDVGGRFSVLSSVGMVPSHLLGLNVQEFLKGAMDLESEIKSEQTSNIALKYAAIQYLQYKSGKNISVLMPYKYNLAEFSKWYVQLIAESLGKKLDKNNIEVFEGITPIASIGPTDQHSQLQLFNEGPNNKVITFIVSKENQIDIAVPSSDIDQLKFLENKSFGEILKLEKETTEFSLFQNKRPTITLEIEKVDEYNLGQLFYFFEVVTTYLGFFLNIDAFNQPGVELSKNAMYGVLGKDGFEAQKSDFLDFKNL